MSGFVIPALLPQHVGEDFSPESLRDPPNSPSGVAVDRNTVHGFLERVVAALPTLDTGAMSSASRYFIIDPPVFRGHFNPLPDPVTDVTPAGITDPEQLMYLALSPLTNASTSDYPYLLPRPGPEYHFVQFINEFDMGPPPPYVDEELPYVGPVHIFDPSASIVIHFQVIILEWDYF